MNQCDHEVFEHGVPLLAATTGPVGGNELFDAWVQRVAQASGQRIDWHYSGGIAHVLVLGDVEKAEENASKLKAELPTDCRIIRWLNGESGLYRAGVTREPDAAIAASTRRPEGQTIYES